MEPATGAAPGDPGCGTGRRRGPKLWLSLGLFPINALHNLVHIVWGILGIVAYRGLSGARMFAKATAIVYGLLTIMGLIPGLSTVFGLMPLYGHDVWLHALIALAAAYFGFAHRDEEVAVTPGATTATSTRR